MESIGHTYWLTCGFPSSTLTVECSAQLRSFAQTLPRVTVLGFKEGSGNQTIRLPANGMYYASYRPGPIVPKILPNILFRIS